MGLFGFGRKDTQPQRKTAQEEALDGLVAFHRERGDFGQAFYFGNKQTADYWDKEFWSRWNRANALDDDEARLRGYASAMECLSQFRQWCSGYEGGESYFSNSWERTVDMVRSAMERLSYETTVLPAEIMRLAGGGIAQVDLIREFDPKLKFKVLEVVDALAADGKITKEKIRNKWILSLK